jgi:hypothetical protein
MSREYSADGPGLDARLAALPRELAPARDLWPGVAASIAADRIRPAAPWRRWPLALAAGVAIAVAAGLIGWRVGREAAPALTTVLPADAGSEALRQASFAVPQGGDYLATRADLEGTYRERLELLAPATRSRIEQDLAAIRAANADIRHALAADPQSPVLNRLLESTWQQEFDLYATVARSTEPAAPRTRT